MPCGAVRCRALRCDTVRCCVVLSHAAGFAVLTLFVHAMYHSKLWMVYIYNIYIHIYTPGGLRRGGLTPACGSAHRLKTKRRGAVEETNNCQGGRCGIKSAQSIASMRRRGGGGSVFILKGISKGTAGRTRIHDDRITCHDRNICTSTGGRYGRTTPTAEAVIAKPRRTLRVLLLYHHFKQSNRMYLNDLSFFFFSVCEHSYVLATRHVSYTACNVESRSLNCRNSVSIAHPDELTCDYFEEKNAKNEPAHPASPGTVDERPRPLPTQSGSEGKMRDLRAEGLYSSQGSTENTQQYV